MTLTNVLYLENKNLGSNLFKYKKIIDLNLGSSGNLAVELLAYLSPYKSNRVY